MPAADPATRALVARIAVNESWARTADRTARTAPARKASMDRFDKMVDPDGTLDPIERAKRADSAKRAYFLRLALASAKARRSRAKGKKRGSA